MPRCLKAWFLLRHSFLFNMGNIKSVTLSNLQNCPLFCVALRLWTSLQLSLLRQVHQITSSITQGGYPLIWVNLSGKRGSGQWHREHPSRPRRPRSLIPSLRSERGRPLGIMNTSCFPTDLLLTKLLTQVLLTTRNVKQLDGKKAKKCRPSQLHQITFYVALFNVVLYSYRRAHFLY